MPWPILSHPGRGNRLLRRCSADTTAVPIALDQAGIRQTAARTGDVVATDTLLLKGATAEAATDLLVMQGTSPRYQYTLTKFTGAASEVVGRVESREREISVAL
jgi:hypothetical protein